MNPTALADWLAELGLRNLPLEEMVDGFSRRLNDMGVPVARTFVGMSTLHPMVRARSMIWDRATGPGAHFEFRHADIETPILREILLPDAAGRRHGAPPSRRRSRGRPRGADVRGTARGGHDGVAGPCLSLWRTGAPDRWSTRSRTCRPVVSRLFAGPPTGRTAISNPTSRCWRRRCRCSLWPPRLSPCVPSARGCWPPISATIRRVASSPARCSAARCRSVDAIVFFTDLRGFTALADITPGKRTDRPARRVLRMHGGAGRAARRRGAEIHGRRPARGLRRPSGDPRRKPAVPRSTPRPRRSL